MFIVSTLPQAKTLVNSVISESGAGPDLDTYADVQLVGKGFAKSLICSTSDVSFQTLQQGDSNKAFRLHV